MFIPYGGVRAVNTDDGKAVLREVKRIVEGRGMVNLSELERSLGISRNWLSGFMSALEALGVVECRGTRSFKIYVWKEG